MEYIKNLHTKGLFVLLNVCHVWVYDEKNGEKCFISKWIFSSTINVQFVTLYTTQVFFTRFVICIWNDFWFQMRCKLVPPRVRSKCDPLSTTTNFTHFGFFAVCSASS